MVSHNSSRFVFLSVLGEFMLLLALPTCRAAVRGNWENCFSAVSTVSSVYSVMLILQVEGG